ncbi:hypothetical protein GPECTOR_462g371 [Gonium pectorale]|uniref:Multiple inositol polyphosphate phosphatase 1 n=1 Tax=Gonium pectorale TaxID=33097 RepID=A0A150FWN2_GONPE|nr:hypothetical protein GPECTOR_462g371 [Gonium pectorale]|eukprot:KXZ41450.1 hypothetical protein GPECTOR_462g371 [Gonium pectorale]
MCIGPALSRGFDIRRHLGTKDARNTAQLPWLRNWTAPFEDVGLMGGELHPIGADELWGLAYRLRRRFPSLSGQDYLPKRFPVVSTQVARTAASASAFTSAFFPGVRSADPEDDSPAVNPAPPSSVAAEATVAAAQEATEEQWQQGRQEAALAVEAEQQRGRTLQGDSSAKLRPYDDLDETLREPSSIRRPQAVAISMAPKDADPLLRFFDVCPAYAQHDEFTERWMSGWMQGNWSRLTPALERKLGLVRPMSPCEVEALWQLCLLEAGVEGRVDGACSLFEQEDALLLEWVDDVHLLETQSYGAPINWQIAAPLLRDAAASLRAAAETRPGAAEGAPAARLLFAHCETLVPLASLLGLFRPPEPDPADASPQEVAAAVSATEAQRHLLAAESVEDLGVVLQGLKDLNGRDGSAPGSGSGSGRLRDEDLHACYKGRPPSPGDSPPPPPGWRPMFPNDDGRLFKGARIAPYGANMAIVLYRRREAAAAAGSGRPAHLVRLLYNEQVVAVPGCSTSVDGYPLDCDLERFLELLQDKTAPDALERWCGAGGGQAAAAS